MRDDEHGVRLVDADLGLAGEAELALDHGYQALPGEMLEPLGAIPDVGDVQPLRGEPGEVAHPARRDVPPGGVCHLAWFTPEGLHIVNVWDSAEEFERFVQERLMPVVKGELGFAGEPEVSVHEAHAVFIIPHPRQ